MLEKQFESALWTIHDPGLVAKGFFNLLFCSGLSQSVCNFFVKIKNSVLERAAAYALIVITWRYDPEL